MQRREDRWKTLPALLLTAAVLSALPLVCVALRAQQSGSNPLAEPARQWAVDAANNEVGDLSLTGYYVRYHSHTLNSKGDTVRDVIQTPQGTVARLILRDNRALSTDEDNAEHQRLQAMLDSPAAFAKHQKNDDSSKKTAIDVIRQMPEAMLYTYAEGQPQRQGMVQGAPAELVIDFHPNPTWSPPNMASDALTGIEGRMWIDPRAHHLVRLEAQVFKPVSVGLGLFAKIFPGGGIALDEARVNDRRWLYTHFQESITLRALMVRTFRENSEARASDFTSVPSMSYQDAIRLLLATPRPQ